MARPERFTAIASNLRRQLFTQRLATGTALPAHLDLMRQFDVSSQTIQKAMDVLGREGFITTQIGEGSFVAERAPHLARFGLVFDGSPRAPEQVSLFARALEHSAGDMAATHNVCFTCYRQIGVEMNADEYQRLEDDVREHRLAGVILVHTVSRLGSNLKYPWRDTAVPFVAIGASNDQVTAIEPDMRSFLTQAIDRLAQQGRRKVAFLDINVANHQTFDDLEQEIVARHGLYSPPRWRQRVQLAGIPACLDLLLRGGAEQPDALIIMDDHAATAAMAALANLDVSVASGRTAHTAADLAVISHGNSGCLPPAALAPDWIGFDTRALLAQCLALLTAQRAGQRVPPLSLFAAQPLTQPRRRQARADLLAAPRT